VVTVGEVVVEVAAGPAGEVVAGLLVGLVEGEALVGEVEVVAGDVVDAVTLGFDVPLVMGGDVARGGGQGGSREWAASFFNCPMAPSRVPDGSPA
jgi:hypothetical protein